MKHRRRLPDSTLVDWLATIALHGPHPDRRLTEAATDLVETMSERPDGVTCALYRFGNTLGADGWEIAQISGWLQQLKRLLSRPWRSRLGSYEAQASVAQGWADGYVRGAHSALCIDPSTGMVTAEVLRQRLQEVYAECNAGGASATELFTLILVDVESGGAARLDGDMLLACVAEIVHDVFHFGETIARTGGRVVVLARHDEDTARRADTLGDRLHLDGRTRWANATVLFDPLPPASGLVDSYLRDLVG